jgi:hypothetical protein
MELFGKTIPFAHSNEIDANYFQEQTQESISIYNRGFHDREERKIGVLGGVGAANDPSMTERLRLEMMRVDSGSIA